MIGRKPVAAPRPVPLTLRLAVIFGIPFGLIVLLLALIGLTLDVAVCWSCGG